MFFSTLMSFHSRFLNCLAQKLLHTFLPAICLFCESAASKPYPFCQPCLNELPQLGDHCRQCAEFLPLKNQPICGRCLTKPPPFAKTFALFPYQPPIIALITGLKFKGKLAYAQGLGTLLARQIQQVWYAQLPYPDLIVPVPLHPRRLQKRGFNQALEIARPIARALRVPLDIHGIRRIKYTAAQTGLTAARRKDNVAGAFALERNYAGLSVAVVDDVITTGHTIMECCQTLKQGGAKQIDVWCCARR